MYLGMALALTAWALWLGNGAAALLLAGFVAYISRFQIAPEERALRAHFGEAANLRVEQHDARYEVHLSVPIAEAQR